MELGGGLGEGLLLLKCLFASEYRRGCVGRKGDSDETNCVP